MMGALAESYAHCAALLREEDKDRWLAALFLPAKTRSHVQALYAYNLEIARVRQRVSEPLLGEIRFQWWREVLAGERGAEAAAHPVAAALLDTVQASGLSVAALQGLIEARLFDLSDEPMPSLAALEVYLEATVGALFRLAAAIVGERTDDLSAEAVRAAGLGYGLTGLLRALPWHVAAGQMFLPKDLLVRHGVVIEAVRAGLASPALDRALAELRGIARGHLKAFFAAPASRAGPAAAVFLPVSLCEAYLRQMEGRVYTPFETSVELPQWRRQYRLWRAARRIR